MAVDRWRPDERCGGGLGQPPCRGAGGAARLALGADYDRLWRLGASAPYEELFAAQGLSNRLIAERLVLSRRTVDAHMERILAKLGIGSRSRIAEKLAGHQGPPHPAGPVGVQATGPSSVDPSNPSP
ncbi:response regulator transcription factor [Streptomyces sp. NPDC001661]